jgi:hypothetical protein
MMVSVPETYAFALAVSNPATLGVMRTPCQPE